MDWLKKHETLTWVAAGAAALWLIAPAILAYISTQQSNAQQAQASANTEAYQNQLALMSSLNGGMTGALVNASAATTPTVAGSPAPSTATQQVATFNALPADTSPIPTVSALPNSLYSAGRCATYTMGACSG
jgi:hypothetical protein